MEDIVRRTLLFDFYGELLTKHQQEIYQDVVCNDMSCSDEAALLGVSRQNVNDLVRRVDRQLTEYEAKLQLVERFLSIREEVKIIKREASSDQGDKNRIIESCDKILNDL